MMLYTCQQLSMATDNKLDHLRSLGNEISSADCCKTLEVRNFVKRMEEKRKLGDVLIREDLKDVQLASYTTPGKSFTRILRGQSILTINTILSKQKASLMLTKKNKKQN